MERLESHHQNWIVQDQIVIWIIIVNINVELLNNDFVNKRIAFKTENYD